MTRYARFTKKCYSPTKWEDFKDVKVSNKGSKKQVKNKYKRVQDKETYCESKRNREDSSTCLTSRPATATPLFSSSAHESINSSLLSFTCSIKEDVPLLENNSNIARADFKKKVYNCQGSESIEILKTSPAFKPSKRLATP
ncbi:uncharacterized protein LOC135120289 [Zophobas morio]|uniref:uncharacterized protein LOC135120289 n=1 Tax=Zophobas morio TaxID=2755281 RepID=UPI00308356D1